MGNIGLHGTNCKKIFLQRCVVSPNKAEGILEQALRALCARIKAIAHQKASLLLSETLRSFRGTRRSAIASYASHIPKTFWFTKLKQLPPFAAIRLFGTVQSKYRNRRRIDHQYRLGELWANWNIL